MALPKVCLRVLGVLEPVPLKGSSRRAVCCLQLVASLCLISAGIGHAASWTPLTNLAPADVELMIQQTDGTILVHGYDGSTWSKLTPDATGSYINGTWTMLAPEPVARLYFASQILPDGRLFVVGGEYSGPALRLYWSNTGEIYDPVANAWTAITPYPNQSCFGLNYVDANVTTGSPHITNIYPYATSLAVGWVVSGGGIPSGATIVSIDSATQITISANATATITTEMVSFNHFYFLTGCVGDQPSSLLPGGNVLVGDLINNHTFIYSPSTVTVTLNPAITPGNYVMVVSGAGISSFPVGVNITAAEIALHTAAVD